MEEKVKVKKMQTHPSLFLFFPQCLDAVKMHQKLVNLGEQLDYNVDTEQVDLCRCMYKLFFQLLLLLECYVKLLRMVGQKVTESEIEVTIPYFEGPSVIHDWWKTSDLNPIEILQVIDRSEELAKILRELSSAAVNLKAENSSQLESTLAEEEARDSNQVNPFKDELSIMILT